MTVLNGERDDDIIVDAGDDNDDKVDRFNDNDNCRK